MNSNFKKIFLSLALLLILSIFVLSGCGPKTTGITIKQNDMPRTTYVVGQELDLSSGILTVVTDNEESAIPLSAEGVSISGYNKEETGKQTVTVTYNGCTTSFEVTVVARAVAEGFKSEYFIGDSFDNSQGRIKIYKDDGKSTTVNLNSEFVSFKSFDSSKAGDATVTLEYNDNAGHVYDVSFTVKVYTPTDISFVKPSKSIYESHETALNTAGGYFVVKAAETGVVSYVQITPNMYSGFEPGLANADNASIEQMVTFSYGGYSEQFKVTIRYSNVSIVLDAAKALKDVVITGRDTSIDPDLAAIAVNAANQYFKLTNTRKALISEEDVLAVMRPAAFSVYAAFIKASEKYSNTFRIDTEAGNLLINAKSYDTLKTDMVGFGDTDDEFNVYAAILNHMKDEFDEVYLFSEEVEGENKDITIKDYIKSPSQEELNFYGELFTYMLNVSDILSTVPDEWTAESLKDYANYIEEAVYIITNSKYVGSTFNSVYRSISSWRTNDDYFEVIFAYYLSDDDKRQDLIETINSPQGLLLPLPTYLQEWYMSVSYGASELLTFAQNMDEGVYLRDTTMFMYYYEQALTRAEEIKAHENKLYRDIYEFIGGDSMIYRFLEDPTALGYYFLTYTISESVAAADLWDIYMDLVSLTMKGKINATNLAEYNDKFVSLIAAMAKLTPSEMYSFICSLNFYYGDYDGSLGEDNITREYKYVFDYSTRSYSMLGTLMAFYTANSFEGEARNALIQLFVAMEKCAVIGFRDGAKEAFEEEMVALATTLGSLTPDERDLFDSIAGVCYNKYLSIYNSYTDVATPDLGEYDSVIKDLQYDLNNFYKIYYIINGNGSTTDKQYVSAWLYPLAEKIITTYNSLLASNDENVMYALTCITYPINGFDMTLDTAIFNVKATFYYYLNFTPINIGSVENPYNIPLWMLYSEYSDLRELMALASDVISAYYNDGITAGSATSEQIAALLKGFQNLGDDAKTIFYSFVMTGSNSYIYYDAILSYFASGNIPSSEVQKIIQIEILYVSYINNSQDQNLISQFHSFMANATASYERYKAEMDESLVEFYEFYLAKYNEIFKK